MANTTATSVENPKKTLVQSQPSDLNPTSDSVQGSTTTPQPHPPPPADMGDKTEAADNGANPETGGPVTDVQKKIRRAERFGLPVQLSEEEKRNSRAERFGTAAGLHGSNASKKSEDQKRKSRAERFGLAQSTPDDYEAKKKARLARFGPSSKVDSVEEDKRKARAARFSQKQPTLSEASTKGQTEKAAV